MLRSSLCNNSDAYKLVSSTTTVPNTVEAEANQNNRKNIIKNFVQLTNCISKINNRKRKYQRHWHSNTNL